MEKNLQKSEEICGLVIVNKETGMTSQTVVNRVKKIFGARKAGHTGTLDPMATGVLPVLLGRGVKASEYMLTEDKHYLATLLLGITTDTEDITGEVLTKCDTVPKEEVVAKTVSSFVGEIMQTPPMYSAIKIGGKKLCDLARRGEVVDREPRKIKIYSIDCKKKSDREYFLDISCSKGTYIRTLCADIGEKLGTGGVMATLTRLSASNFDLSCAHTLREFEKMSEKEKADVIIPIEKVFSNLRSVFLPDFFAKLAHSGLEIYTKKIGIEPKVGERVKFYDKNGFFAIGEVRNFEDGTAIKPIKQF